MQQELLLHSAGGCFQEKRKRREEEEKKKSLIQAINTINRGFAHDIFRMKISSDLPFPVIFIFLSCNENDWNL